MRCAASRTVPSRARGRPPRTVSAFTESAPTDRSPTPRTFRPSSLGTAKYGETRRTVVGGQSAVVTKAPHATSFATNSRNSGERDSGVTTGAMSRPTGGLRHRRGKPYRTDAATYGARGCCRASKKAGLSGDPKASTGKKADWWASAKWGGPGPPSDAGRRKPGSPAYSAPGKVCLSPGKGSGGGRGIVSPLRTMAATNAATSPSLMRVGGTGAMAVRTRARRYAATLTGTVARGESPYMTSTALGSDWWVRRAHHRKAATVSGAGTGSATVGRRGSSTEGAAQARQREQYAAGPQWRAAPHGQ
jgi:hypothetical protein